jgi:hypothetical protein
MLPGYPVIDKHNDPVDKTKTHFDQEKPTQREDANHGTATFVRPNTETHSRPGIPTRALVVDHSDSDVWLLLGIHGLSDAAGMSPIPGVSESLGAAPPT